MTASIYRNTCDRLGCCQAREPACPGCTHTRGARDEDPPLITPDDAYTAGAVLKDGVLAILIVLVVGYISGYLWELHSDQIISSATQLVQRVQP
jgi:hypothetical protein